MYFDVGVVGDSLEVKFEEKVKPERANMTDIFLINDKDAENGETEKNKNCCNPFKVLLSSFMEGDAISVGSFLMDWIFSLC